MSKIKSSQLKRVIKEEWQRECKSRSKKKRLAHIIQEEYHKIQEETKPHEKDRHPPDTPPDRIREENSQELSHQISMLEDIGEHIAWALGRVEDPQVATRLEQADTLVTDLFAAMHGGIQEETKPHEEDRKPPDTPEDRIRK